MHCSRSCARKWPMTSAVQNTHSRPLRDSSQNLKGSSSTPALRNDQGDGSTQPHQSSSSRANRPRILFYDKHAPHYGFTNFSDHPVVFEGKTYPTSEHLFQSFKFQRHRPDLARHIRKFSDQPRVAFTEARRYQHEIRPDWHHVKIEKMEITAWHKFTQHPDLEAELLATGDAELIEDSPVDAFWGVGPDGKGRNELGKVLMRLRTKLQATT